MLCGRPAAPAAAADVPGEQQTVSGRAHGCLCCGTYCCHSRAQYDAAVRDRMQIALPAWGCLDDKSSWREFADGAGNCAVAAAVAAFQPEAVLGVDWHSLGAWQRLQQHHLGSDLASVPFVYLNYRQVATASCSGCESC